MDEKASLADANTEVRTEVNKEEDKGTEVQQTHNFENKSVESEHIQSKPVNDKQEIKEQSKIKTSSKTGENAEQSNQEAKSKVKRFNLQKRFNMFKRYLLTHLSLSHIKERINHYIFEYKRVLMLSRKPTRQEYKELTIMVTIGTLIVGIIGFVIQLLIQFI